MHERHGTCVLVVEDDPHLCDALADVVEFAGLDPVLAYDGVQGWERLASGLRPALVLLDHRMPRMSGTELLARIRADPDHASIPVVLMTGLAVDAPLADRVVAKPYDFDELVRVVRHHCGVEESALNASPPAAAPAAR